VARGQTLTVAGSAAIAAEPVRADLSIIIPTLNEERNIGALIRSVRREIESLGISHELLVIDGGSTDRTIEEVEQAGARWFRQIGSGFGSAVREGMKWAGGEWVLLMDADWSHPPEAISDLWNARSEADLVIGSRTVGGSSSDAPLYRRFLTGLLHLVFAAAFHTGVRDVSSGFRLYRRAALTPDLYSARHFDIQVEVLFTSFRDPKWGAEVPLRYDKRAHGRSNAGVVRDGLSFIRRLWMLRKGDR
jgi:dolichol-phosphate mannosyltransferase